MHHPLPVHNSRSHCREIAESVNCGVRPVTYQVMCQWKKGMLPEWFEPPPTKEHPHAASYCDDRRPTGGLRDGEGDAGRRLGLGHRLPAGGAPGPSRDHPRQDGGEDVDHAEEIELRAGDRIRWTRYDARLGLVDSRTAEVESIGKDSVAFRLEDGRMPELDRSDPQLLHIDHAWASKVHGCMRSRDARSTT